MKKKRMTTIGSSTILLIALLFIVLHSTSNLALRTHVFFFMLHPVSALSTGVKDDTYHNTHDKDTMIKEHAKAYTLTNPPKEGNVELSNYVVKKVGFLYFAKYLGYY